MYWQDKWIAKQYQCPKIPDLFFLSPSRWGIAGHTSHKDTSLRVLDSLPIVQQQTRLKYLAIRFGTDLVNLSAHEDSS